MALTVPTVAEIKTDIIAAINLAFGSVVSIVPKSFIDVLASALAGVFILTYKYGSFIFKQIFVSTATLDTVTILGLSVSPLTEWGRLLLRTNPDPIPATQASYTMEVSVETPVGTIPVGTPVSNADNGVVYLTTTLIDLTDVPPVTGLILAASDQSGGDGSGTIGNLLIGDVVSFVSPQANVARDAAIASGLSFDGIAAETEDAYRARILGQMRNRIQGGALVDYTIWGTDASLGTGLGQVAAIFPYTSDTPGEVDVFVEGLISIFPPDGIPSVALQQAVLDSIELNVSGLATRRPATARPNVFPITRTGFDVTVTGLSVDDPTTVQADINTAVTNFFLARNPFVSGVTSGPRTDLITRSAISGVVEDIVTEANGTFTGVSFKTTAGSQPIIEYRLGVPGVGGLGEKAKLTGGTVTFSP